MIKDHHPYVNIIIPCFNMANYLESAIESALGQTYRYVDVTVVNDGSSDETAEVAGRFAGSINYVEIIHSGLSAARNAGIEKSSSEFLLFLDADDQLFPDAVEHHLKAEACATSFNAIL